jgi:hypothetical protein
MHQEKTPRLRRPKPHPLQQATMNSTEPNKALRRPVKQRWYYEAVPTPALVSHLEDAAMTLETKEPDEMLENLLQATDKYEAAIALQPEAARYSSGDEICVNDLVLLDRSACGLPESLGVMELITDEYLAYLPMDEIGAQMLQGTLFYEHDLLWCRITGWEVENSIPMVFYSPILADDIVHEEEYASLGEIIALLRQSECAPVLPKFGSSRVLRLSENYHRNLCCKQVSYKATYSDLPSIGYCTPAVFGVQVGSYNGLVLTNKKIK